MQDKFSQSLFRELLLTIEELLFEESSLEILLELDKPDVIIKAPLGVNAGKF